MRQAMICKDCQHFDSPEYPPKRAIGACELELEPMPPDAPACDEFMLSWDGDVRHRDDEWARREELAGRSVEK